MYIKQQSPPVFCIFCICICIYIYIYIYIFFFFFPHVVFSGAGVWSWEDINRLSRGHMPVELPVVLWASPDNTVRPDQNNHLSLNRWPPPVSQPDISSTCLFYLFNKQNKLNLHVGLIFLATTRLYITSRN